MQENQRTTKYLTGHRESFTKLQKIYNDLVQQLNTIPKQTKYDTFNILYRVLT